MKRKESTVFNSNNIYTIINCYMQVHPSRNYIPMVISSPNYTSLPSIVATFLAICLIVVLQPFRYSIFHSCYDLKPLESDNRTTLVLSNTRELDRVPNTK